MAEEKEKQSLLDDRRLDFKEEAKEIEAGEIKDFDLANPTPEFQEIKHRADTARKLAYIIGRSSGVFLAAPLRHNVVL